ncbi:MAG: helix-turn-helix transcriptional regulator [Candidatus Moraniibacteriota bacterium]
MPKPKSPRNLKNRVRQYRLEKKISQKELALILGVTRQTIIALEKQRYSPSLHLALRLAKYFSVKVEELFKS